MPEYGISPDQIRSRRSSTQDRLAQALSMQATDKWSFGSKIAETLFAKLAANKAEKAGQESNAAFQGQIVRFGAGNGRR